MHKRSLACRVSSRIPGPRRCSHSTMLPAWGESHTRQSPRGSTSTTDHMLASAMTLYHRPQTSGTDFTLEHQAESLYHRIRLLPRMKTLPCSFNPASIVRLLPVLKRKQDEDAAEHVVAERMQ